MPNIVIRTGSGTPEISRMELFVAIALHQKPLNFVAEINFERTNLRKYKPSSQNPFTCIRDLKVDGCQSNLYIMLKLKLLSFYKFYDFFCRWYSLMNRPCYDKLFRFMQRDDFWNLNTVIFIHWKHLEPSVNVFWYCFPVIKWYNVTIRSNQLSFQGTRALLKYCNCLIYGVIKV